MSNVFGKENDAILEEMTKLSKDRSNILAKKLKIKRFNQYNFWRFFVPSTCLWFHVEQTFDIKKEIYKKVNPTYGDYHYESIKHVSNRHLVFG